VVDQLDLDRFLAAYRADGHGTAGYDPKMLLGVLLCASCTGICSSHPVGDASMQPAVRRQRCRL